MVPSQIEFSSFSVSTIEYLFIGQYYSLSDLPIYSDLTKFETYCLLFCGYFEWRLFWQIYIWILLTNAFLMFLSSSEVLAVTMLMIKMSQMSTNPYSWVKFGRIPIQKSCLMASGLAPQSASWSNARLVGWKGRDSAYPHGQWLWVCFLSDCDANSPPTTHTCTRRLLQFHTINSQLGKYQGWLPQTVRHYWFVLVKIFIPNHWVL